MMTDDARALGGEEVDPVRKLCEQARRKEADHEGGLPPIGPGSFLPPAVPETGNSSRVERAGKNQSGRNARSCRRRLAPPTATVADTKSGQGSETDFRQARRA